MAHYLVRAKAKDNLTELRQRLDDDDIRQYRPAGGEMTQCLNNARLTVDGWITWEENCYCNPPLKQERRDVLDHYFTDISTETVSKGEGWQQIDHLPSVWSANS